MNDNEEANFCVCLRITRDRGNDVNYLIQEKHILNLLLKFNMADCKPVSTNADPNQKLTNAKLGYSKNSCSVVYDFCDPDWASDADERRSSTGYMFVMQGGAISWNSKRQPTIPLLT